MKSLEEVAYSEIGDFIRRDVNIFKPDDITSEILGFLLEARGANIDDSLEARSGFFRATIPGFLLMLLFFHPVIFDLKLE